MEEGYYSTNCCSLRGLGCCSLRNPDNIEHDSVDDDRERPLLPHYSNGILEIQRM